ncbi:MAG: hypothetical protein AAFQ40_17525 [Cyanobacteria bacterium J06623_5]
MRLFLPKAWFGLPLTAGLVVSMASVATARPPIGPMSDRMDDFEDRREEIEDRRDDRDSDFRRPDRDSDGRDWDEDDFEDRLEDMQDRRDGGGNFRNFRR